LQKILGKCQSNLEIFLRNSGESFSIEKFQGFTKDIYLAMVEKFVAITFTQVLRKCMRNSFFCSQKNLSEKFSGISGRR